MPRWSPLGVKFKIFDEHLRLFHMGVPPPGLLLLDNFTPDSNYLRSVPLEFLTDLTGLTGFRSMNVLLIDWLTKH